MFFVISIFPIKICDHLKKLKYIENKIHHKNQQATKIKMATQISNASCLVVKMPASRWFELAIKKEQPLQRCIFSKCDFDGMEVEEVKPETPFKNENDIYEKTNTGFRSLRPEHHPFLKLKGTDMYIRADSHISKKLVKE
jgi:hypothetical protein